jgi:cobyrinic acid a,c-diamide synthase
MKCALIAGTQSGCGKTSVTLAVLQFIEQQGRSVRAFKTGPDFLDPMWHQEVTQKTSYNLDTQMIGGEQSLALIHKHHDSDFGIIEGVMGLFDGREGVGGKGSGADLAKELDVPVWLVVDAKGMSGSIVPLVKGFVAEAERIGFVISGIIANRLGSDHHAKIVKELLVSHKLPPLMAWMKKGAPILPERHLGLQMPEEHSLPYFNAVFQADMALLEASVDSLKKAYATVVDSSTSKKLMGKNIAVARDASCCFIYPRNLEFLEEQGATLDFFSPIAGDPVPERADAVWLPGGYPELHTQALSSSSTWMSLAEHINQGKPCLAECGGMMMLADSLTDHQGTSWTMAGILPIECHMQDRLASLGYREDLSGLKGHEYHHSKRVDLTDLPKAYTLDRGDEGVVLKNLRASYVHWYFDSAPQVAAELFIKDDV